MVLSPFLVTKQKKIIHRYSQIRWQVPIRGHVYFSVWQKIKIWLLIVRRMIDTIGLPVSVVWSFILSDLSPSALNVAPNITSFRDLYLQHYCSCNDNLFHYIYIILKKKSLDLYFYTFYYNDLFSCNKLKYFFVHVNSNMIWK